MSARMAVCPSCKTERLSDPSLPFFQDRSPGTQNERCSTCRYSECAHDPEHMETLVHNRDGSRRPTVVEDGRCSTGFVAMTEGCPTDTFYCGCKGWD